MSHLVGARQDLARDRSNREHQQAHGQFSHRECVPQAQRRHANRGSRESDLGAADRSVIRERWQRSSRWLSTHSIRVRLYSVIVLLFALIVGLGAFGSAHLSDVNHASEVIRNRWLRDTGILGDISNYMSDYRAAEANRLLASTAAEEAAS